MSFRKGITDWSKKGAERYLADALGRAPGLPAKAAQFLAMRLGVDLTKPTRQPAALSVDEIREIWETRMPPLASQVREILPKALPASLGQVNLARLSNGDLLAVKTQYPGVESALVSQLDRLIRIAKYRPFRKKGLDLESYREYFRARFDEELDYRKELEAQNRFVHAFRTRSGVVIPRVFPELSDSKILVQSYESSVPLQKVARMDAETREACVLSFLDLLLSSIFETRLIHTDPHPSNWGFRPETLSLVLYDFGSSIRLLPEQSEGIKNLIELSAGSSSSREISEAFQAINFDPKKLQKIEPLLSSVARTVFLPILEPGTWSPKEWRLEKRLDQLLGPDKWWFRSASPPWFAMVMRACGGWVHAWENLGVRVALKDFFETRLQLAPMGLRTVVPPFTAPQAANIADY